MKYNCPNCGAPIGRDEICPYCGTKVQWVPVQTIEFVPINLGFRHVRAECAVHDYEMEWISPGFLENRLVDQLAELIVKDKAYELSVVKDPFKGDSIYRLDTYIGVRKGR